MNREKAQRQITKRYHATGVFRVDTDDIIAKEKYIRANGIIDAANIVRSMNLKILGIERIGE